MHLTIWHCDCGMFSLSSAGPLAVIEADREASMSDYFRLMWGRIQASDLPFFNEAEKSSWQSEDRQNACERLGIPWPGDKTRMPGMALFQELRFW